MLKILFIVSLATSLARLSGLVVAVEGSRVLDGLGWGAAVLLYDEVVVGLLNLFGFQVSLPFGLPGSFLARNGRMAYLSKTSALRVAAE